MIRAVVIEDDARSRSLLVDYLQELPGLEVVGEAADGLEGRDLIERLRPDAVFLDVELPGLSGPRLARTLVEPRSALVFVTAHAEHAVEAFRLGAAHYLMKPVNRVELAQALTRLYPAQARREWLRIPARTRGRLRLLDPQEVEALVADLGDCQAWTREGALRVEGTLAQWEERLAPAGFLRVHRNALVRLEAIQGLEEGVLQLPSGSLPLSRRRREELQLALELRIPAPAAMPRP